MKAWQAQALKEVEAERSREHPFANENIEFVEFVSKSNGRNRPKRKRWREVRLVTWRGRTLAIGNYLTKKLEFLMQDVFPEIDATYTGLDWLTAFVEALRNFAKVGKD